MRYADALTVPDAQAAEECTGVATVQVPGQEREDGTVSMWVVAAERDPQGTVGMIVLSEDEDEDSMIEVGPETSEGIGIGSDSDTVKETFPDARMSRDEENDTTVYFLPAPSGGGLALIVGGSSDTVREITVSTGTVPSQGDPCDSETTDGSDIQGSE